MTLTKKNFAMLLMVVCSILWSTAGIFIKLIKFNPLVISGFRGLIAGLVILTYMKIAKIPFILNKKIAIGAVSGGISFIVFVIANKLTTAANAIVLQYTLPIFILIFSAVFFKKKTDKTDIIATVVTFFGIILFFFDSIGTGSLIGNLLSILSGAALAGMFVVTGEQTESERLSCICSSHLFTAIFGIPFVFFTENTLDSSSILFVVILGILQLGLPYILFGIAVGSCPPLACSLISAIEPLLNPVWVFIFAGEAPGKWAFIGGIIVVTAVTARCVIKTE